VASSPQGIGRVRHPRGGRIASDLTSGRRVLARQTAENP
jgi:hypothetical protein